MADANRVPAATPRLRRRISKATLKTTSGRMTLRLQRVRNGLRRFFTSSQIAYRRQNYFTERLPPEIRLQIYRYLLQFDAPIILHWLLPRAVPLKDISILLVNRLTYNEALPILYALNTIVVPGSEFQLQADRVPQAISYKPQYLRQLHINTLDICTQQPKVPFLPLRRDYVPSLQTFLNRLRVMPRLERVTIEYHRHAKSVQLLVQSVKRTTNRIPLSMTCTGVGRYELKGAWLRGITVQLVDIPLAQLWSAFTAMPFLVPNPVSISNYRSMRSATKTDTMRILVKRYGVKYCTRRSRHLAALIVHHDIGAIPIQFARIWPARQPTDFRLVESFASAEFFHEFNVVLQAWLEMSTMERTTYVPRW